PYPMIIANILAKPLMKLAPQFAANLARDGDVILSGILAGQRHKVLAAFRQQGLYHQKTIWREGWVTLHLRAG
ncbi:MAG: 50S ribosomal protein L11 methyltransferase, partial [Pseudomonadota bacterium]